MTTFPGLNTPLARLLAVRGLSVQGSMSDRDASGHPRHPMAELIWAARELTRDQLREARAKAKSLN